MKKAMLIDQTKCIGCSACSAECKDRYGASYGIFRTKMVKYESGSYPNVKLRFRKNACMHCEVAACEAVCPVNAIFYVEGDNGRMVEVDKETCIGCGACINACPFTVPQLDPEDGNNMEKCSFCAQRVVEDNKSTFCAEACPVGAIREAPADFKHLVCFEKLKSFQQQQIVGQYVCGVCVKACFGEKHHGQKHIAH